MEVPDVSLDSSSSVSIFSASPDVKIRGKTTRKFKKERNRQAADLFEGGEEDDDSLSFKHGKDNTFDRLCAGKKGKNGGGGNVAGRRGRVRSPFSPVDDNSKVAAPTLFSSSGECLGASSVFSSDASGGGGGGGLFDTPKEKEDSGGEEKRLRVKKTAGKTAPKRLVITQKQAAVEVDTVSPITDSMLEYCKRPVRSRETSSASDGNESAPLKVLGGNDYEKDEVFGTGGEVVNVQPRVSFLQLEGSPSASAFMQCLPASTPIGDGETEARNKG